MDIIMENMKENKKLNNELMFKKRNINGIVPTTEDRNIRFDNLFVYTEDTRLKFKEIEIEFFRTTHSIPDSHGISINTPDGRIVTTGDYKFDLTPIGPMADLYKMASLGEQGVDLLISDSTNALNEGFSNSESVVDETLNEMFDKWKNSRS